VDDRLANLGSAAEAIQLAARRDVVAQFERHLLAVDADDRLTEPRWEDFFRENPWLLGLNLRECVFLSEVQEQPDLGGKDLSGVGGQRGDSLMASGGCARFTVLVALKHPDAQLTEPKPYRNKAYKPGAEVIGGVVQVQAECFRWDTGPSNIEKKADLRYVHGTFTMRPDGIVVVGNLKSIEKDEEKLASFQIFRTSLHGVAVVTFDELLDRARALVGVDGGDGLVVAYVPEVVEPSVK
jgi:hypothetical protein